MEERRIILNYDVDPRTESKTKASVSESLSEYSSESSVWSIPRTLKTSRKGVWGGSVMESGAVDLARMAATRASRRRVVMEDPLGLDDEGFSVKKLVSSWRFWTIPPRSSASGVLMDAKASTSGANSMYDGRVGTEHVSKTAKTFAWHVARTTSTRAMHHPEFSGTPNTVGMNSALGSETTGNVPKCILILRTCLAVGPPPDIAMDSSRTSSA